MIGGRSALSVARLCIVLLVLILCIPTVSCAPDDVRPMKSITVLGAASLHDVITELAAHFEAEAECKVVLSTGASGALRKQIELGSPGDVFISADPDQVDALAAAGRTIPKSRRVLAANRLVLVLATAPRTDGPFPEALASDAYRRIAIANPDAAPAGRYAIQALRRAPSWPIIQRKLVIADDVRSAAQHAVMRTVDAAVIYRTDVPLGSGLVIAHVFPADAHDPILYVGTALAGRNAADDARRFLEFLISQQAQPIWRKYGFDLPGDEARGASPG